MITLESGATFAGYQLGKQMRSGYMGQVFEARSPSGERVALKALRFAGTDAEARFAREANLCSRLDHPNIVKVLAHGVESGLPFLVMPFLDGMDLQATIEAHGPLRPSVAVAIVRAAAVGLRVAHAADVVHRDVKPANLMLTTLGDAIHVVVCDFGIAKAFDEGGGLTASGAVLGTPLFMAPEQFLDSKRVDARCDVWGLGMTLYNALAGRAAYEGIGGIGDLLGAMAAETVPQLQDYAPSIAAPLARAVHGTLLPRERRLATMEAFIAALDEAEPPSHETLTPADFTRGAP